MSKLNIFKTDLSALLKTSWPEGNADILQSTQRANPSRSSNWDILPACNDKNVSSVRCVFNIPLLFKQDKRVDQLLERLLFVKFVPGFVKQIFLYYFEGKYNKAPLKFLVVPNRVP